MRLLLDTHILLWWMGLHPSLTAKTRALIDDPDNEPIVSAVCLWEIAVKIRTGKMKANIPTIAAAAERQRFTRLGVKDAHLETLLALPFHHRDPFDHLLIAQAIAEDATFLTADRMAARYPVKVVVAA